MKKWKNWQILVMPCNMQRIVIVEVSHRDYVIDNGVDEDDALTYPLFSTSTIVIFLIRLPTGVTHIPHFSPTPPPLY